MINKKIWLLSLAVVFFIIGVHQSFYFGIQASYWAFMISGLSFLWMQYLKKQDEIATKESGKPGVKSHNPPQQRKKKRK